MSKSQRNMCILVCLLFLLIILCTATHMSSIKISKPVIVNSHDVQRGSASVTKNPIDFVIIKEEQMVALSGNFDKQIHAERLVAAIGSPELSEEIHLDNQLLPALEVIEMTEELLVPFMERYVEGSIAYQNGQLIVEGSVEDRADKNRITTILANSTIPSVDNTKIVSFMQEEVVAEPKNLVIIEEKVPIAPVTAPEVKESTIPTPIRVEESDQPIVTVPEVNVTLPKVPEVNVTLPTLPKIPSVPSVEPSVKKISSEAAQKVEAEIQKVIDFEQINFELNQADLTLQSLDTIKKIAEILEVYPNIRVEIAGHTDSTGDDQHNLNLSQQRVDRVKEELMRIGVKDERLVSVGYGETRPLVPNDTKENREKNRRVQFTIIGE